MMRAVELLLIASLVVPCPADRAFPHGPGADAPALPENAAAEKSTADEEGATSRAEKLADVQEEAASGAEKLAAGGKAASDADGAEKLAVAQEEAASGAEKLAAAQDGAASGAEKLAAGEKAASDADGAEKLTTAQEGAASGAEKFAADVKSAASMSPRSRMLVDSIAAQALRTGAAEDGARLKADRALAPGSTSGRGAIQELQAQGELNEVRQQAQASLDKFQETQARKASPAGSTDDTSGDDGIKITKRTKQVKSSNTTVVVDDAPPTYPDYSPPTYPDFVPADPLIPQAEASSLGLESLISSNRIALHTYYATSKALMQAASAAHHSLDENCTTAN